MTLSSVELQSRANVSHVEEHTGLSRAWWVCVIDARRPMYYSILNYWGQHTVLNQEHAFPNPKLGDRSLTKESRWAVGVREWVSLSDDTLISERLALVPYQRLQYTNLVV